MRGGAIILIAIAIGGCGRDYERYDKSALSGDEASQDGGDMDGDGDAAGQGDPATGAAIINPGFEQDCVGWVNCVATTAEWHGGSNSAEVTLATTGNRLVSQDVDVVAGATYRLGGWVKTASVTGEGCTLRLDFLNGMGAIVGGQHYSAYVLNSTDWLPLVLIEQAPAEAVSAELYGFCRTGTGVGYYDDFAWELM